MLASLCFFGYREWPAPTTCPPAKENELLMTFGTGREPLSRALTVDFPPSQESRPQPSPDEVKGVAVRLGGDLRSTDGGAQLPTNQVTVGSTRINERRVTITSTVDPMQSEQAPAGCYRGAIVVESEQGAKSEIPLLVDLGSRSSWRAAAAFAVLLLGAFTGLTIKWITESLTPLGFQRSRLDALRRELRLPDDDTDLLPVDVQGKLDDLDNRIRRGDLQGISDSFKELETQKGLLRRLLSRLSRIERILRAQQEIIPDSAWSLRKNEKRAQARRDIETLIEVERGAVAKAREFAWPAESKQMMDELDRLEQRFRSASMFIDKYKNSPDDLRLKFVRDLYFEGKFEQAEMDFDRYQNTAGHPPMPAVVANDQVPRTPSSPDIDFVMAPGLGAYALPRVKRPFQVFDWATRRARVFAALASVLIVGLVGLKLEYLEEPSFHSHMGDWLTLFLWAAVVELSGVSVLDVVGRLGTSGAPTPVK